MERESTRRVYHQHVGGVVHEGALCSATLSMGGATIMRGRHFVSIVSMWEGLYVGVENDWEGDYGAENSDEYGRVA